MPVEKSEAGITPKVDEQKSLSKEGETPAEAKVSAEEKLYSQKQLDTMIHMAKSEAGRDRKTLETERDQFKTKVEKLETDIGDIQSERDKLQVQIEELTSDDPRKFDLVKRDKDLRDAQRQLKKATDDLSSQQKASEERVKLANDTLLEISIWEVAAEYQGGDPVKLKDLCSTFNATSDEQVRKVADTIWTKTEVKKPEGEPLKIDSGNTRGGGELTEREILKGMFPNSPGLF